MLRKYCCRGLILRTNLIVGTRVQFCLSVGCGNMLVSLLVEKKHHEAEVLWTNCISASWLGRQACTMQQNGFSHFHIMLSGPKFPVIIKHFLNFIHRLSHGPYISSFCVYNAKAVVLIVNCHFQPPKISIRKEEWEHRLREVQVTKQ